MVPHDVAVWILSFVVLPFILGFVLSYLYHRYFDR